MPATETRSGLASISDEMAGAIERFNQRMADGGSAQRLSTTRPFPLIAAPSAPIEIHHLAYLVGEEARGGVNVKSLPFRVAGRTEPVAFYNRPLSEGIVNPRFAMVGLYIQKEVCRRFPLVYGLGVGDLKQPVARLMMATGWSHFEVPFHFTVFRAGPFLRNYAPLRGSRLRRIAAGVANRTGLGAAGLRLLSLVQACRGRRPSTKGLTVDAIDDWGEWADALWDRQRRHYSLVGERTSRVLGALYPRDNPRFTRLRVSGRGGEVLGWAVVTVNSLRRHHYFGDARLGAIVDMFGAPGDARAIAGAATEAVRRMGADLLVVNQTHAAWNAAFRQTGLLPWKTNWFLFLSPALTKRVGRQNTGAGSFFFTRGDGDGPINLW